MTEPSAIEVLDEVLSQLVALIPEDADWRHHICDVCDLEQKGSDALATLRNQVDELNSEVHRLGQHVPWLEERNVYFRNQVEQMEGIIERVTFLAEHWDTWAGVLLREALSTSEPENPEMRP